MHSGWLLEAKIKFGFDAVVGFVAIVSALDVARVFLTSGGEFFYDEEAKTCAKILGSRCECDIG